METNLTNIQTKGTNKSEYALFLPATSGFYSTFVGKQRYGNYVDPARVPQSFKSGVESLNYLDPDKGQFYYKWCLYSAGHANLDLNKFDESEDMFRNRNRIDSFVLADSGGFQIAKNKWPANWADPNCPIASKKRKQVLEWMDTLMDYGMCLDIPAWITRMPDGIAKNNGINNEAEAILATDINNEYFIRNRNGNCKFLNVLQGESHTTAYEWYDHMKKYCDPKVYGDNIFNGWAMGGQNMCSPTLVLKRLVILREDGLLEKGLHDWMHFLGTSKLEWALFLTDIQKAVRKYHNENFNISFDCASPFLAVANGQIYTNNEFEDRKKWVYRMIASADNKKYATDTRLFKDAVLQDKIFKNFESSPLIDQCAMKDICIYKPGDLNKVGKEGRTSWDSFSYAIQMGHNVYQHVTAVQKGNQIYENRQSCPAMLVDERTDLLYAADLVDYIFAQDTGKALQLIEDHSKFLSNIIGTRGLTGKREWQSMNKKFFVMVDDTTSDIDDSELDETKLDELEEELNEQKL